MELERPDPAVERLAGAAGVVVDWVDAWGEPKVTPTEDLIGVLEALFGTDLDSQARIAAMTAELEAPTAAMEPVVVAWDGLVPPVPVDAPIRDATLVLEDGSEVPLTVADGSVRVPHALPMGYHRLAVNGGDHHAHVLSAPMLAHPCPTGVLGLIAPAYSLRRRAEDHGIGTLADLRALADLCGRNGVEVVGTLPLLAAFPDQPSPYAPASRRAWNELFVDPAGLPDSDVVLPSGVGDPAWVDYDGTGREIRRALAGYARHVSATSALRREVGRFLDREPEIRRYARFRAVADALGHDWRAWPSDPDPHPDRVRYHETVQWAMDRQLRDLSSDLAARGQYLYLDLPIGCHPDGYDIWDTPELFAPASLGAPPDTLFVGGQDWGLPASIPHLARLDGHANFRKAIRRQLSVARLLRIDHVMGVHRAWWVPHGAGATHGGYVMQPTDELFATICIESVRAGAGVIGENLGTVPPEIRTALDDHGLMGMAMATDGVTSPRPNDLVALSSHDTPSFAAWWNGNDIDDLSDLEVFDEPRAAEERRGRWRALDALQDRFGTDGVVETRDAMLTWMSSTPAAVALTNLDDLIMEERRQNIPGTDRERPNWRLRHSVTIEDMAEDGEFTGRLRSLSDRRPLATP